MIGFTLIGLSIAVVAGALLLRPVFGSDLGKAHSRGQEPAIAVKAQTISVVVPARNEQRMLPLLLQSLAAQSTQPLEIIVVDDQSTDATAEIARSFGARVVCAPPRPEGWLGKPWACHLGSQEAAGDHLLFLDADVILEPHAIAVLAATELSHTASTSAPSPVVSVQPYHRTLRLYERLALFFNVQIFVGAARRSRGLRLELEGSCCYGPCIFCSRHSYEEIGGHEGVKDCVLEDIELGDRFRAARIPVFGFSGKNVMSFRMYPNGLRTMIDGFSKNLLLGARRASAWFFFLDVFWVCGLVAAPALLGIAVQGGLLAEIVVSALFYVLLAVEVWLAARRLGNFGPILALIYPVPLLAFILVAARVAVLAVTGGHVSWKGRSVSPRLAPGGAPRKQRRV